MRRYARLALLTTIYFSASPLLAQDAKETLANIPDDAVAVMLTPRFDQSSDKIHALIRKMEAPIQASPRELMKSVLGISKGIHFKGCGAVAVFSDVAFGVGVKQEDADKVAILYFIPVTSYQEFLAPLKAKGGKDGISDVSIGAFVTKKMVVGRKGSHAVLAEPHHREALKKALKATKDLGAWSESLQPWLATQDLAVLATPRGLKLQTDAVRQGLAQARLNLDKTTVALVGRYIDALDDVVGSIKSDVSHLAMGGKLDTPGNLHVELRALFAKDSGLSRTMADLKASADGPLAGLPAGPFAVAFGGQIHENVMKEVLKLTVEVTKMAAKATGGDELPKDRTQKLEEVMARTMGGIRGVGYVIRDTKPGDPLFGGMISTMKVGDAQAYLANYEKYVPELNALYKNLKIPGFEQAMEVKTAKFGKVKALQVITKYGGANDPLQKKLFQAMFGLDGNMTMWLAAVDDTTILSTYGPDSILKQAIAAYNKKGGLQTDAKAAVTLKMLPPGAQWNLLVDMKGATDLVGQWVKTIAPETRFDPPAFPSSPPVGVGLRLSESGLTIHAVVPGQFLEGIGKLVKDR